MDLKKKWHETKCSEGQSAVKWSGMIGEWFKAMTGVRQGYILSPFCLPLL